MTLNEHERLDIDLDALLEGVTPSVLTPNLTEIASLSNEKKPKRVAQLLVKHLHQQLGTPPAKEILHDGAIHQIRYFDIEPMMKGVWCEMSLMLLHLSYGEQCTLIEAVYPKDVQLAAKVFASHFTKSLSVEKVDILPDNKVVEQLDTANVGISMILACLMSMGHRPVHPDVASKYLKDIETIADDKRKRTQYAEQMERKDQAYAFRGR